MNYKEFAFENARTQAEPHGLVRAGNTIEWFKCTCGEQSTLIWKYKKNSSRILACSIDCAVKKVKGLLKHHHLVDE